MTPEEARQQARRAQEALLVSEAQLATQGWRFLTIDGLAVEDEATMELYEQVIDTFWEAVGPGGEGHHFGTSSALTLGIRSPDAEVRVGLLRESLEALNPTTAFGRRRWTLRDGMR